MDPAPELHLDLARMRAALDELERLAQAPGETAIRMAREAVARIEKSSKTQRLDFQSFSEMAGRINAQGLDIRKIEGYLTVLLRGRLGASAVTVLRASTEDGVLVAESGSVSRLELATPLGRKLIELGRPTLVENTPGLERLRANDVAVVAPLVQRDAGENVLRGVLLLGPRVTPEPYDESHLEFLGRLTELIGIALHNAFLHYVATHDTLTEIWSRGHFDVELRRELSRAVRRRERAPPSSVVSLVMLDIDHFKQVNDTFGHRAGDRILKLVATTLRRNIRDYDTLARWGGEEFAVVLPDAPKQAALEAAERFRRAVREARASVEEGEALPVVTASFGVATWPDDAEDVRELVRKADLALYRSKESGRDRVTGA
jgi:diguanylate cyclase (GGDEF)-like protein